MRQERDGRNAVPCEGGAFSFAVRDRANGGDPLLALGACADLLIAEQTAVPDQVLSPEGIVVADNADFGTVIRNIVAAFSASVFA